jgi:hypothetical protein
VSAPHELAKSGLAANRSLPIDLWPKADRLAWELACQPPNRLKRGGAAGHLKPVTRDDLARRYGYFLEFLSRSGSLAMDKPAAEQVTPENVDAYHTEIKQRVSSVTVYGSIRKLRRTSQIIAPGRDFAWLTEIEQDLALTMRPRSKSARLVMAEVLVEAGDYETVRRFLGHRNIQTTTSFYIGRGRGFNELDQPSSGTSGPQRFDGRPAGSVPHQA